MEDWGDGAFNSYWLEVLSSDHCLYTLRTRNFWWLLDLILDVNKLIQSSSKNYSILSTPLIERWAEMWCEGMEGMRGEETDLDIHCLSCWST